MSIIIQILSDYFGFVAGSVWTLINALLSWIVEFVTETVPNIAWALLPDGVADYLKALDFATIDGLISTITWFIPFWTIVAIYGNAIALQAGIRLVRWIIGFIPTIEG